jgi:hypothetical protein
MNRKIVFSVLVCMLAILLPKKLFSQEYAHELGIIGGMSSYMGDANKTKLFLNPGATIGGIYRYNVNFHWAIKGNLIAGFLSGNTADAKNVFPSNMIASFDRTFVELGSQIEFNFFPYSDKYGYLRTKPYTPYLLLGIGATFASGDRMFFNANIPLGLGFKYKIRTGINVGIEFSMRKLFADNLDVTEQKQNFDLDAPYKIESSIMKNQDWYSLTLVSLTWEFGLKKDPCHGM